MRYINNLMLFLLLVLVAMPLRAQETRYRVEVLVLTHLNSAEPATELDEIRDYSSALDFLTPVEEPGEEETAGIAAVAAETTGPGQLDEPAVEPALAGEEEPDPNEVVHQPDMSDTMREAWRRLRLSAPFRPQQYLSWEQGDQEPFPVLRVHDLEVVLVRDPLARERLKAIEADLLEDQSEKEPELTLATQSIEDSQVPAGAPEMPEEPGMPGPTQYYRLDGTVTLRRSRFLHLDLDLQMREGTWEPEPLEPVSTDPVMYERAGPTSFLVHELQQSRQVKTGRMEYFDSPALGVLATITAIRLEDGEGDPDSR